MDKRDYVLSLNKVKLVIGNGFDLHCGLHTTYSDYYCKNWRKFRFIQKMYHDYLNKDTKIDFADSRVDSLNVWDVFFALNSSENPYTCKRFWCDIERLILSSLMSLDEAGKDKDILVLTMGSSIHWPDLMDYIVKNTVPTNHEDRFVVGFILDKMKKLSFGVTKYYEFLLQQLNEFELSFGKFIYCQIHDCYLEKINYGNSFYNSMYLQKVKETLSDLCTPNNLVGIDSFNYSHFSASDYKTNINYINGSYSNPIFGIDSVFEPNDPRFIFTKTSRRIESNIVDCGFKERCDYENVLVFGHSLCEADYSYFFPVFDRLNLLSHGSKGKLIFAFSIYNKEKEQEIRSALRKSVSEIILTYAKEKQVPNPKRFLDMISTQGKVLFYEIPDIKNSFAYYPDNFESEWKKMLKEMDDNIDK